MDSPQLLQETPPLGIAAATQAEKIKIIDGKLMDMDVSMDDVHEKNKVDKEEVNRSLVEYEDDQATKSTTKPKVEKSAAGSQLAGNIGDESSTINTASFQDFDGYGEDSHQTHLHQDQQHHQTLLHQDFQQEQQCTSRGCRTTKISEEAQSQHTNGVASDRIRSTKAQSQEA